MSWKTQPNTIIDQTSLLQDLSRLVSDWVWEIDNESKFTYVSDRIFDFLNIPPLTLIGANFSSIGQFIDNDEKPIQQDLTKPFRDVLFKCETKNFQILFLLISSVPVYNPETGDYIGTRGIAKDITQQRIAERDVARLIAAFEVISEVLFIHDKDDRLIFANRQFRRLNEDVSETLELGTKFIDHLKAVADKGLVPDAIGREQEWIEDRLKRHNNPEKPFELTRQNGQCFLVSEERLPDRGIATFSMDITHLKETQRLIKKKGNKHRQFVADMAHELRTPLSSLVSSLENLKDCVNAKFLQADVMDFSNLLDQLLMVTRFDGWHPVPDEKADLNSVCKNALSQLAPLIIQNQRKIELVSKKKPVWVIANSAVLEHALQNLIELTIPMVSKGAKINVEVSVDQSISIFLDKIISIDEWDATFNSANKNNDGPIDNRTDNREPLSYWKFEVVKRIIDAHNGTLSINSHRNNKSSIVILF